MYRKVIPNIHNVSLDALLEHLKDSYPQAEIKKPWIGPKVIKIKEANYVLQVIISRGKLMADFQPPILWSLLGMFGIAAVFSFVLTLLLHTPVISIGGAIPFLIGFLIVKAIFRNQRRADIDRFYADVEWAAAGPEVGRIF